MHPRFFVRNDIFVQVALTGCRYPLMMLERLGDLFSAFAMNRFIAPLLTLVMVAHSLAGCCCHYMHSSRAGTNSTCCHQCCHSTDHDQCSTVSKESHGGPKKHCDGSCLVVREARNSSVDVESIFDQCWVMAFGEIDQHSLHFAGTVKSDSGPGSPPIRLHLWHQILLI